MHTAQVSTMSSHSCHITTGEAEELVGNEKEGGMERQCVVGNRPLLLFEGSNIRSRYVIEKTEFLSIPLVQVNVRVFCFHSDQP